LRENFKIAIPMAGLGTRMRPHTWSKPKPLIHLAGRTVLDYVLEQFNSLPGLPNAEFMLILSPNQGEQVIPYVQEHHADKKVHFFTQGAMRGQSDALYLTREYLHGPMLMSFSDTLIQTDLSFLEKESMDAVAWVKEVPDPRRFGVAITNERGEVTRLIEKPKEKVSNLAVVGFYYFRSGEELMRAIEEQFQKNVVLNEEYFLADAINILIQNGARMRVQPVDVWLDAGKPKALLETNRYLLENGADNSAQVAGQKGVTIIPPVYIHPEARINECVIGPHVSVGKDVYLFASIIRNSIVEQGAHIERMVLEGSLIGRKAQVKGRAETMNIGDDSWIKI